MNLQPCGDAIAVAAADPAFGVVDSNGPGRHVEDRRYPRHARQASTKPSPCRRTPSKFASGLGDGAEEPVLFDLGQATVTSAPNAVPGFSQPVIQGLPVSDWKNSYKPTFAGKPIPMDQYEISRSLAIRPDHKGFVLGTEYWLRAFDADGKEALGAGRPEAQLGASTFRMTAASLSSAYGDGTIRWHRWSDGAELLALFVNRKTKAWVAWTPSGYYMASPGGEDLIGWHVNRGWNQAADFFPASKFHDKYARADIVDRVLDTLDEGEAIRQADLARPQKGCGADDDHRELAAGSVDLVTGRRRPPGHGESDDRLPRALALRHADRRRRGGDQRYACR